MQIGARKRIGLLLLIMAGVALTTGGSTLYLLYRTSFEQQTNRLVDTVDSRARQLEAIARFALKHNADYPGGPREATIAQIRDAHHNFPGFGRTGEFTLAERLGDKIIFLLSHRHYDLATPQPVSIDSSLAEPMRRALAGASGTLVGPDYRGKEVLAAYEFVKIVDLGIVAKIDMEEVRRPFVKAGGLVLGIATLFITLGSILFIGVSEPLIRQLAVLAKFPHENPNPVLRVSGDRTVLYSNRSGQKLLKAINHQAGGIKHRHPLPERICDEINRAIREDRHDQFEFTTPSGQTFSFLVSPVSDSNSVYLYGVDITERIELMGRLRLNEAVLTSTHEGVLICDRAGDIEWVNPAFTEITGHTAAEVVGRNPRILKSGKHDKEFYQSLWKVISTDGIWQGEIWNRRKNGDLYLQESTINAITDDRGTFTWYAAVFRDITKRKENEDLLKRLSATDGLTGLANRRTFDHALEQEWSRAQRTDEKLAVAIIDIDYFKPYNDNYGHQQGDICLKEVALALSRCIQRTTDLVARYGGEEFVVILPMTDLAGARALVESMRAAVAGMAIPHAYSKTSDHVTISIGLGMMRAEWDASPETIVKLADEALYAAKEEGRNRVVVKSVN